jgi:hypothetical protein
MTHRLVTYRASLPHAAQAAGTSGECPRSEADAADFGNLAVTPGPHPLRVCQPY